MQTRLKTILSAVTAVLVTMVWISAFGAGTSGEDTIDHLLQRPDRTLWVFPGNGAWNNPDGCDDVRKAALDPLLESPESFREKFAIILGAHLNGNVVRFGFSGCILQGNLTVPMITNVTIF